MTNLGGSRSLADTRVYAQDTEPTDNRDGVMWVDTSGSDRPTYVYSTDTEAWEPVATKDHQLLTNVQSDDHHARYTDSEAKGAVFEVVAEGTFNDTGSDGNVWNVGPYDYYYAGETNNAVYLTQNGSPSRVLMDDTPDTPIFGQVTVNTYMNESGGSESDFHYQVISINV